MRREATLVLSALISACGTASTTTDAGPDAGVSTLSDAGTLGDAGTLVGTFQLLHLVTEPVGSASLVGKIYDGPSPQSLVWELDTKDGDCELQTPRVPFCATPCGGSAVCVENDTCQAYAASKPVGTVHVSGVLTTSVTTFDMSPIVNGYQPPASVTLAVPPFADAAPVTLVADGSASVIPFTLTSSGVAPFTLTSTGLTLISGSPLELTWAPGSTSTAARVKVKLDISHHGGTRGQVLCDTDDDGALSLSGALVTKLINLGVAGFPTIVVRRQKVGSTLVAAGRVDLLVGSELEQAVGIPGLTSCTADTDCTTPQTCQTDLRCQ